MFGLPLDKAKKKTVRGHQYYVFPAPRTHTNQRSRPGGEADPKLLIIYSGAGTNNRATLLPEVHSAANVMMRALRNYGDEINDWSMKSAVIQNGYRPNNEAQGSKYLWVIKETIREKPEIFGPLTFPANLEAEARGVLGRPGDARRTAFVAHVAEAPGWNAQLAATLFRMVDAVYTPRGSNPHATGLVFDLDFSILDAGREWMLGAQPRLNSAALRSAAGMWLNTYAPQFGFDSYDTGKEIWHQEFRSPNVGPGSPELISLLDCCLPTLQLVGSALKNSEQTIRDALRKLPL